MVRLIAEYRHPVGAIASTHQSQRNLIAIQLDNFRLRTFGQPFLVGSRAVRRTKTHAPIIMLNAKFSAAMIAAKCS
jgi:hypothetical protein